MNKESKNILDKFFESQLDLDQKFNYIQQFSRLYTKEEIQVINDLYYSNDRDCKIIVNTILNTLERDNGTN